MGYDMQIKDTMDEAGYFRLNIWGMSEARGVLAELGMLVDASFPEFPDWKGDADESDPAYIAYQDQCQAITDAPYCDAPEGIPAYKLSSNDGWLVTPQEINAALARLRMRPEAVDMVEDFVAEFLAYMAKAAQQGGFRVW